MMISYIYIISYIYMAYVIYIYHRSTIYRISYISSSSLIFTIHSSPFFAEVPWLPRGFWRCRLWSAGSSRCPRATHASCPSRSAGSIFARGHWHGAIQGTCHRAWGAAGIVPYPAVFQKKKIGGFVWMFFL